MPFQPFANYTGYHHCLGAAACFVHPANGNVYFTACEQHDGARQDLSIYRMIAATGAIELVKRYRGTVDSEAHIERGGCVIGQGGALFVATSLIIPGVPQVTTTGFQACWIREPNIDAPWSFVGTPGPQGPAGPAGPAGAIDTALRETVATLQQIVESQAQQLTAIEAALGTIGSGVLSDADTQALAWLHDLRSLLRVA